MEILKFPYSSALNKMNKYRLLDCFLINHMTIKGKCFHNLPFLILFFIIYGGEHYVYVLASLQIPHQISKWQN